MKHGEATWAPQAALGEPAFDLVSDEEPINRGTRAPPLWHGGDLHLHTTVRENKVLSSDGTLGQQKCCHLEA